MEHQPQAFTEPGVKARLSLMMFLQYAIWGAWLPFLFSFLSEHRHMSGEQIGAMFAAGAAGAVFAPFFAGQIADRWFATEKYLAISHLIGAVLIWNLASIQSSHGFLRFSFLYSMCYAPTMPLTNSLAFHHLKDRDREFGSVRLWGTFGWIVVGLAMGHWLAIAHSPPELSGDALHAAQVAGKIDAFKLSAILGGLMGLYCLTLPHTPPAQNAREKNATFEALGEVRRQPLLSLFLLAVPVSCIHQFYFVHAEGFVHAMEGRLQMPAFLERIFGVGGGGFMTIGQMTEVLVLGSMPFLAARFSRKSLLAIGLIGYATRMALFAYGQHSTALLLLGLALHGPIFGCFIFLSFMIVDEQCTPDVRASAQSLYNLVIVGIGVIVGSLISGWVSDWAKGTSATPDYTKLFSVPMWASLACLVVLLLIYPGGRRAPVPVRA
jgi:nucleoside transporter